VPLGFKPAHDLLAIRDSAAATRQGRASDKRQARKRRVASRPPHKKRVTCILMMIMIMITHDAGDGDHPHSPQVAEVDRLPLLVLLVDVPEGAAARHAEVGQQDRDGQQAEGGRQVHEGGLEGDPACRATSSS